MPEMNAALNEHPPPERLQHFGQGLLAPEEAALLEEHLSVCDACCCLLERAPSDSFVGQLRDAQLPVDPVFILSTHPRYRVIRLLGQGGMGDVYLAEHRRMNRLVALKVINPALLHRASALARFQLEAQAAAKLAHANIVAAYDADQAGCLHFLVMEYVEGQNLADRLRDKGPMRLTEACDMARQAALGLQHAHERGMVHRDIKPHNLMLTQSGQLKVLDFGLALLKSDGERREDKNAASDSTFPASLSSGRVTGPGAVMGTADYIAPEQARDAHQADARSDIYSLGCTLYHLLTGQPPFPQGTTPEKLQHHDEDDPMCLRTLRPEVPQKLAKVVTRMMAKRPDDRYRSAAEVAQALAPYANGVPKRSRPRRWLAAAGLGFLALGLAAASIVRLPVDSEREIVIDTDDPEIKVVIQGDRLVRIVDPQTGKEYLLDRKDLTLSHLDDTNGLTVTLDGKTPVLLKRHGKRIASVRLERPAVKKASPFEPLFNGKDLTGWVVDGGPVHAWSVQDGMLVGRGGNYLTSGFLLSERSYADFQLRFEFQLSKGANSGVALRAVPGEGTVRPNSPPLPLEVQILDDGKYRRPDGTVPNPTGSLFWSMKNDSYLPADVLADLKPLGSWNDMVIEAHGSALKVLVNGRPVLNTPLAMLAKLPAARPGVNRLSGRIGFQQHTGEVRFRNIEIMPLDSVPPATLEPTPTASLFNGKDLTGWQGLPGYWKVRDGTLIGAPANGHKVHTFLCSQQSYADFELKFKVRRKDGVGNTGVQFRSTFADPRQFTVVGPQIEIDAATFRYPPGSIVTEPTGRPAIPANRAAVAKVWKDADFNDMTLRCVGKHVTVHVNGVLAVDDDFPSMPNEGIIAWQLHGGAPGVCATEEVVFKDIQFIDLSRRTTDGFVPLFNGKDLTGWKTHPDNPGDWRVEDGALVGRGPRKNCLYSVRGDYVDFHFRIEATINARGNSGQQFRRAFTPAAAFDGYEAQIDNGNHAARTGSLFVKDGSPVVRVNEMLVPPDTWFTQEVIVKGNHITILVNGQKAAAYIDQAWTWRKGHLALQLWEPETVVRFRKIEVKELSLNAEAKQLQQFWDNYGQNLKRLPAPPAVRWKIVQPSMLEPPFKSWQKYELALPKNEANHALDSEAGATWTRAKSRLRSTAIPAAS